ncbi:MAG: methyl-accepting chemotaxis protein [Planctomycetota bacterium]
MRWTIGMKLGVGFAAVVALVLVVAGVSYRSISGLTGESAGIVRTRIPAVDHSLKLQSEIHHALSMHRGYMILGLPALAEARLKAWEHIDEHMAALRAMAATWSDPAQVQALTELETVMAEFREAQQVIADTANTPDDLPASKRYLAETLPLSEEVVHHIEYILHEELDLPATPERKALTVVLAEAEAHLLHVTSAISAFLESGAEEHLALIDHETAACSASVERLQGMASLFSPDQATHFQEYLTVRARFLESARWVVETRMSPGYCVSEDVCLNQVAPLSNQAEELIGVLVAGQTTVRDDASHAVDDAGKAAKASIPLLLGITFGSVVIGLGIAFVIGRSMSRAVGELAEFSEKIAARDLSNCDFEVKRNDELGTLGNAVKRMALSLREVISDVSRATEEVGSASEEIAASNTEMADAIRRQSGEFEQVSSAVTEMGASIAEVASQSQEAAQQAQASGDTAASGGSIVQETVEGMESIEQAVRDSATSVEELGRRGEQIGGIIETINEIAEQTNLLALNAAIEAARAGEHGRGFAVVADEVRKLAERTTVATDEVTQSVNAIQEETGRAVERMNAGTENVTAGVELATRAGESLREIVDSAGSVKSTIETIAQAAQEQNTAAGEVDRAIGAINAESEQTSRATEQAVAAASELAKKAEHLRGLVSEFKL